MKQAIIKKQFWKDVSAKVANLNPRLAKIINEINPGCDFLFMWRVIHMVA